MILSKFEKENIQKQKLSTKEESQWSRLKEIAVVDYQCYATRVHRGVDPEEAATTPRKKTPNEYHAIDGIMGTRKEHCDRLGFNYSTITVDMNRYDLTFEEAIERRKEKCKNSQKK